MNRNFQVAIISLNTEKQIDPNYPVDPNYPTLYPTLLVDAGESTDSTAYFFPYMVRSIFDGNVYVVAKILPTNKFIAGNFQPLIVQLGLA